MEWIDVFNDWLTQVAFGRSLAIKGDMYSSGPSKQEGETTET